ncbi:MAG TPA: glycoside hydrolase family 31 protein [Verrucomicrobiales bacterium]|nr:glycoside hydrolase family 31 protein [Verrucomicrobiales bacterium]
MEEKTLKSNYMETGKAEAARQFHPGKLLRWSQDGASVEVESEIGTRLRISVLDEALLRFRFAPEGRFPEDFSYAVDPNWVSPAPEPRCREEGDGIRIETAALVVKVGTQDLRIRICDREGMVLSEDERGFHWEPHRTYGGEIVYNSRLAQDGECFYGLGDKSCALDMRGRRLQLWGSDTYGYNEHSDPLYKNIPFFLGVHHDRCYGMLFDNSFRSFFDFGHERSQVMSFFAHGGEMDYYFFGGDSPLEVIASYARLTGRPELPPLWALGYHQCKWTYDSERVVRTLAKRLREERMPCEAIYLDIEYMDGFRCFTWDRRRFPDPPALLRDLRQAGFRVVAIIDPGIRIDPGYSVWRDGFERDVYCRRGDGPLFKGSVWPGPCHFPDFTRPAVRDWWAGQFQELLQESGVAGIWNDMNEPAVFEEGTFPRDVRHDYDGHPCSHRRGHNVYGSQMVRASLEGIRRFLPDRRPFNITRSGYAGFQRYACTWTGDNVASWAHLRLANIQCQRLACSGVSFCGSDAGGFLDRPDGELFVRWMQLAAFHPFFRNHSSGDHGDQEPWSFGEPYTSLAREAIELRCRLLPYFYTAFRDHVETGRPVLRSLVCVDHADSKTHGRMDEFMVGDALLVCPVTAPGQAGSGVYLPRGGWYDFWTGDLMEGGTEVWVDTPLARIPLFVREGTVLPLWPVRQHTDEAPVSTATLRLYPGREMRESVLYEDAGEGMGYREGDWILRRFRLETAGAGMRLAQAWRGPYRSPLQRFLVERAGASTRPRCEADGRAAKVKGDPEEGFCVELEPGFREAVWRE